MPRQLANEWKLHRRLVIAGTLYLALLAIPTKSYVQPLIIMGVIPFGIIGAIFGHMLLGYSVLGTPPSAH